LIGLIIYQDIKFKRKVQAGGAEKDLRMLLFYKSGIRQRRYTKFMGKKLSMVNTNDDSKSFTVDGNKKTP
jgi:hypothetical protein